MRLVTEQVGPIAVNCHCFQRTEGSTLFVIDPGGDSGRIADVIRSFHADGMMILLTHAHVDHISGLSALLKLFPGTKVYLHPGDKFLYESPDNALEPYLSAAEDLPPVVWPPVSEGLEVLETPGHSPGGAVYYFPGEKTAFTGDTLFASSIGRTDFPGGDYESLIRSIREKLFSLPDDVKIFPGHGPDSVIGREKDSNPFFR